MFISVVSARSGFEGINRLTCIDFFFPGDVVLHSGQMFQGGGAETFSLCTRFYFSLWIVSTHSSAVRFAERPATFQKVMDVRWPAVNFHCALVYLGVVIVLFRKHAPTTDKKTFASTLQKCWCRAKV